MTRVIITNEIVEKLKELPRREAQLMKQAIDRLAEDPVLGSYFLRSTEYGSNLFVMRVGNYRIIYGVNSETNTVTIIRLSKKDRSYTELPLEGGVTDKNGD